MADGNRLDVFFVHPNRGKRMVYGAKTHEKLGYIGYGSFIGNVHESDVAARPSEFICGVCQKPFTVIRDTAYCQQDFPPAVRPQPRLGDLKPRSAQQRITAAKQQQQQQQHTNFQGQPLDPWQDQGYNPNAGFNQQAPPPPPPPRAQVPQQPATPVFNPPPPEPPPPPRASGSMDNPASVIAKAREQKSQAFGIPTIEPGQVGPPPNLATATKPAPPPEIKTQAGISPASDMSDAIADIDFGRSVNKKHKQTLADNGVNTLYDAMKLGNDGLQNITGIGAGVSSAIMGEVDSRLV